MHVLLLCLVLAGFATLATFWMLYFTTVRPRIEMAHGRGAYRMKLLVNWPYEAVAAYGALLRPDECARWINRFIRYALAIHLAIVASVFALVLGEFALG